MESNGEYLAELIFGLKEEGQDLVAELYLKHIVGVSERFIEGLKNNGRGINLSALGLRQNGTYQRKDDYHTFWVSVKELMPGAFYNGG